MELITICIWIAAMCLVGAYIYLRFRENGFYITPFNISILMGVFVILIGPIFLFRDSSWHALGISSAVSMFKYTNESLLVNSVGLFIFGLGLTLQQIWKRKLLAYQKRAELTEKLASFGCLFDSKTMRNLTIIAGILFSAICLAFNGTFPLFNDNRSFFQSNGLVSPIFLALTVFFVISGLFHAIRFAKSRKGLTSLAICLICLLLTGSRGQLLMGTLLPAAIIIWYMKIRSGAVSDTNQKKLLSKSTVAMCVLLAIVVVTGLLVTALRSGSSLDIGDLASEIVDGNTFSDIRDGAFILNAANNSETIDFPLYGKSYAAGVLSFVPSSMSPFRQIWSWGRLTTSTLLGWENHFGLRGGWFMEAYLNFSLVGVIILAILLAKIYFLSDEWFNRYFMKGNENFNTLVGSAMVLQFLSIVASDVLITTSGFYNLYVFIFLVGFLVLIKAIKEFCCVKFRLRR